MTLLGNILFGTATRAVQATPELYRVLALPRRQWDEPSKARLAELMTVPLRKPLGEQALRPIQALALYELSHVLGLFGIIRVGAGKTLISFLAPRMLPWVSRPLLLTKAALIDKTRSELRTAARDWNVATNLHMVSYDLLGRPQAHSYLDTYRPDMIICDEGHKVRNRRAAVTRRLRRYLEQYPQTVLIWMTGTISKRSLRDYCLWLRGSLRPMGAPIPQYENELEEWADALDEKTTDASGVTRRMKPGALTLLCDEQDKTAPDELTACRRAYRKRLTDTRGVVATPETPLDCSLSIVAVESEHTPQADACFTKLRQDWETPDGWPISDPMTLWRHARELALGFFYRWDPRPPEDWYNARKAWAHTCRRILSTTKTWDSEAQVTQAVLQGAYGDAPAELLREWRRLEPSFAPNTEIVWVDYKALELCQKWANSHTGILWCEHVQFAETLARGTGLAYYGRGGKDALTGKRIEEHPADKSLIASIASNSEGRNLQAWSQGLIISPPANGPQNEQLLARQHREGQEADEVEFSMMMNCIEHYGALEQAKRDARYTYETQGQLQKLLYADITVPSIDVAAIRAGARWGN